MTDKFKAFQKSEFMKRAVAVIDTFYFLIFCYGAYQLFNNIESVAIALNLIAKK